MKFDIGIITSIATLIGLILTIFKFNFDKKKWKEELKSKTDQWNQEFETNMNKWKRENEIDIRLKFLDNIVQHRSKFYPEVLKHLGKVRDDSDPYGLHHNELIKNKSALKEVADKLTECLYGEAGLFMSFETRNCILKAIKSCYLFQQNEIQLNMLVTDFFIARRKLREDLQIDDLTYKSEVSKLAETIRH